MIMRYLYIINTESLEKLRWERDRERLHVPRFTALRQWVRVLGKGLTSSSTCHFPWFWW